MALCLLTSISGASSLSPNYHKLTDIQYYEINCQTHVEKLKCETFIEQQPQTMECVHCRRQYKTKRGLSAHKCTFCQTCKVKYRNVKELSKHNCINVSCGNNESQDKQILHNQTESKDVICELCGRHFKSEKTLKTHKCSHCKTCGKTFSDHRRYSEHKCHNGTNQISHEDKGNHKVNRNFCSHGQSLWSIVVTVIILSKLI